MLYKHRHEIFLSVMYFGWLIVLVVFVPAGFVALLASLMLMYLVAQKLNNIRFILASLVIILAAEVGLLLHIEDIYSDSISDPSWYILVLFIVVFAYYVAKVWHKSPQSSIPAMEKTSDANERQKLVALVNSMADGVVATDQNQKVTIYNGAALDVLNLNVSLEGQELSKFMPLYDRQNNEIDIFDLAHKSRTSYVTRDLILKYKDDEKINVYLSISPVSVGYGQKSTLGYIILIRDITKEKSLEEERDEFISVVSHELRTPVTVAEGAISNAQFVTNKENASEVLIHSLEEAHKSTIFLADMINDLSTLSRAEQGKLLVEPESIDIVNLLNNLAKEYEIEIKQKKLKLIVAKSDTIKPVNSAPLYVKEILQNFIANSIKYTEKGTITLTAKHTDKGVDVAVKDTGIGISKSDQKKLFDKFFRSEDFRTRQNSGTGLGLYVTMKLAHLIGAQITVTSKINVGSEFKISIPNLEAHHHRKRS